MRLASFRLLDAVVFTTSTIDLGCQTDSENFSFFSVAGDSPAERKEAPLLLFAFTLSLFLVGHVFPDAPLQ